MKGFTVMGFFAELTEDYRVGVDGNIQIILCPLEVLQIGTGVFQ